MGYAPTSAKAAALVALIVGVALGVLTLVGQGVLDANWNRLANSGAIWVSGAFIVGSLMPSERSAAAVGLGALIAAVLSYYISARLFAGAGVSASSIAIWLGTAVVGGPVFGLAGRSWRGDRQPQRRLAVAVLAGVYVAEGASTLLRIPNQAAVGWVEIAVGIGVLVALSRSNRDWLLGLVAMLPIVALGVAAYAVIDLAFSLR